MHDEEERPSRAKWHLEISGAIIAIPDSDFRAEKEDFEADHALRSEINRCWLETQLAYAYGSFQSATLLASIVVELSIERYLRRKNLWDEYAEATPENYRTLGSLISYCRPTDKRGGYLTPGMLTLCDRLTTLRNEAAHMNKHRYMLAWPTEDLSPPNDMDEVEDVAKRTVSEKGEVTVIAPALPGEPVFIHPAGRMVKLRAFKPYAREATSIASQLAGFIASLN